MKNKLIIISISIFISFLGFACGSGNSYPEVVEEYDFIEGCKPVTRSMKSRAAGGFDPYACFVGYTYIGGAEDEDVVKAINTSDGGICVLGYSFTGETEMQGKTPILLHKDDFDFFIVKLNAKLEMEWFTYIGSTAEDKPYDIVETVDGDFIVYGYVKGNPGELNGENAKNPYDDVSYTSRNMIILKLNSSGEIQWFTFALASVYGETISLGETGDIFIAGNAYHSYSPIETLTPINVYSGSNANIIVFKYNNSGILQWYTYLINGLAVFGNIASTSDNGLIIGDTTSLNITDISGKPPIVPKTNPAGSDYDSIIYKLKSDGTLDWFTYFGSLGDLNFTSNVIESTVGGYVVQAIAGLGIDERSGLNPLNSFVEPDMTDPFCQSSNCNDSLSFKLSESGQLEWFTYMGGSSTDLPLSGKGFTNSTNGYYGTILSMSGDVPEYAGSEPLVCNNESSFDAGLIVQKMNYSGEIEWYTFLNEIIPILTLTGNNIKGMISPDGSLVVSQEVTENLNSDDNTSPISEYSGGKDILIYKAQIVE